MIQVQWIKFVSGFLQFVSKMSHLKWHIWLYRCVSPLLLVLFYGNYFSVWGQNRNRGMEALEVAHHRRTLNLFRALKALVKILNCLRWWLDKIFVRLFFCSTTAFGAQKLTRHYFETEHWLLKSDTESRANRRRADCKNTDSNLDCSPIATQIEMSNLT